MRKLKVGIAGYGVVGKKRRACIENNENLSLVALCDQNFDSNNLSSDGIQLYKNYQDMLEKDLDILIVCMSNDVAAEVTIAGLDAQMHVFCEKPPGRSVNEIKSVIAVEKKYPKLKLKYGFNHRYHDSVIDAIKIIHSGELGSIINMRGIYGKAKLITFNQTDWRTNRNLAGGGVLLDQGIHMLDLMRLFAGEFNEIHSFVSNTYWGYEVEDNAYALMRSKSGVVGMLNSSATQWRHRFNLDIGLERGSIILGGILSSTKSYGAETLTTVWANPDSDNGDPREQITRYNHDPSWQREIDDFVKSIIDDEPIGNGNSRDALETMKLVFSIYFADLSWRNRFNVPDPKKD